MVSLLCRTRPAEREKYPKSLLEKRGYGEIVKLLLERKRIPNAPKWLGRISPYSIRDTFHRMLKPP